MNGDICVCICIYLFTSLSASLPSKLRNFQPNVGCREVVFHSVCLHYKNIRYYIWWWLAQRVPGGGGSNKVWYAVHIYISVFKANNERNSTSTEKGYGMWSIKTNCLDAPMMLCIFIHIMSNPIASNLLVRRTLFCFRKQFYLKRCDDTPGYVYGEKKRLCNAMFEDKQNDNCAPFDRIARKPLCRNWKGKQSFAYLWIINLSLLVWTSFLMMFRLLHLFFHLAPFVFL